MRLFFALLLSIGICVGIFFGMHLMTNSKNSNISQKSETRHLVYLREKTDTNIERKKRVKPKEPPKKPPLKKIKIVKTTVKPKVNQNVKIKPFKAVAKNIELSKISSLSGAQIEAAHTLLDARSLKTLKKVNPKYPRRASIKKLNGFVKLSINIEKNGSVSNIKVLEAQPKGIFEKSAIKAIKRWRFEKNKDVRVRSITFNYKRLENG